MSADRDKSQGVAFYFGNAARDLGELLPADEAPLSPAPSEATSTLESIHLCLDSIETQLQDVFAAQRELRFLIEDLRRLIV